jgi:hypothetical protein
MWRTGRETIELGGSHALEDEVEKRLVAVVAVFTAQRR